MRVSAQKLTGWRERRVMQSQTKIFSRLIRDYMRREPIVLARDAPVRDVLAAMAAGRSTSALIVGAAGRLDGIVTERDVTRRIALRCTGDEPAADVMTTPVRTVNADDYLYAAIAAMRRHGWRHMPVVEADRRPVGMIGLKDALAVAADQTVRLIEDLAHEGTLDGLKEVKAAQVEVAEALLDDSVPAPEIQALLSDVNRDIHRRILDARIAGMEREGLGPPPAEFAVIVMGSGGRGENFLYPDQDNGFVIADYPDSEHDRIDGWFRELAERMCRDLDAVGFPWCKGYVMAVNPLWRKTLSQWRAQLAIWGQRHSFVAVRLSDIFFDFQPVYGQREMGRTLRQAVAETMQRSHGFLQKIHAETGQQSVALGWFGRFVTEKHDPAHRGELNLKQTGTLPLVQNLRLLALRHGIAETPTLARIDRLRAAGVLGGDEADYLAGGFRHIAFLLLRQQVADFRAGRAVSNYVHPQSLSARERDILKDSFRAIEALRERMHNEMTGDVF